jgi:glycosyltransferase involved in cell wall biosynthesis
VLNYNYAHFLGTCLDSILGQTFRDFELILINDGSTDSSAEVSQPYLADPRVRLVEHAGNKGFVRSLIEGCDLSRGTYITVISADDWCADPTAFERQIAVMEQDTEIAFAFTAYGFYADEQRCDAVQQISLTSNVRPGRDVFQELVLYRPIHHSGTMIRRSAYERIGGYDPHLRYALDAQLWLGLCHVGKVAYLHQALYAYRHHGANMSKNTGAVSHSIHEVLQILDWSFGMLPPADRRRLDRLYARAVRRALADYAMIYTFQHGSIKLGWHYFWAALRLRPIPTLFQKATLMLALRTILGQRGYRSFEQAQAIFSSQTRARLRAEVLWAKAGQ